MRDSAGKKRNGKVFHHSPEVENLLQNQLDQLVNAGDLVLTIFTDLLVGINFMLTGRWHENAPALLPKMATDFGVPHPVDSDFVGLLLHAVRAHPAWPEVEPYLHGVEVPAMERLAKDAQLGVDVCFDSLALRDLSAFKRLAQAPRTETGIVLRHLINGTLTGRIHSSPFLQNLPKDWRGLIFRPRPGYALVGFDYSAADLRSLAALSGDQALIDLLNSGLDFHDEVAARLGVSRREAKVVAFGSVYGAGSSAISEKLGVPVDHAGWLIQQFDNAFPQAVAWRQAVMGQANKEAVPRSFWGRRLPLCHQFGDPAKARRQAVNWPCQATSADVLKIGLARLPAAVRALFTIFDEIVLEVPVDGLEDHLDAVDKAMTGFTIGPVKLAAKYRVWSPKQ